MAVSKIGSGSMDFPAILSDEEFEARLDQRERTVRAVLDSNDAANNRLPPPPSDGLPASTIEQRFPHVAKMLVAMWPSAAFALYVSRMVVADRENRAGFPRDVIEDMLMLDEINDMLLKKVASRDAEPLYTATDHTVIRR